MNVKDKDMDPVTIGCAAAVTSAAVGVIGEIKKATGGNCSKAQEFNLDGQGKKQVFYMVSPCGDFFLGGDHDNGYFDNTESKLVPGVTQDPIPVRTDCSDKEALENWGIRFVFFDGYLYCKCHKFGQAAKTHAYGVSEVSAYTFASYHAKMTHKFKWNIKVHDNKVIFESYKRKGLYLSGNVTQYRDRIFLTDDPDDAYFAVNIVPREMMKKET